MSWRTVVVTGNTKLDYKLGYLVVRKQGDIKQVHLSEIEVLMVESTAVSLTSMLLCELVKNKINVVFCDNKHNPISELVSIYGSHDTSAKVREQVTFSDDIKARVWTKIVEDKIRKQKELLWEVNCQDESKLLQTYIDDIQYNDSTNREGHAAKVYFNALFGKAFVRGDENATNAALNYGYGILLSYFNREIVANGYLTQLGVFHNNIFNQFNMSSDLMEPFRILVDRMVFKMELEKFETEEKHELLSLFYQNVRVDRQLQSISNAIKIYVQSVFYALNDNNEYLIKFYNYEL
ncbi:MAG: type II CRISPR-associated endonuclease Cas1 [Eubacterium sp.]|nr:type II CRISPR-associated endonuclease Cas1 [Eubacterium sp.]